VRELNKLPEHGVIILDNMSKGHKESIPDGVPVELGDIRDTAFLNSVFTKHKPDAVMVIS
jgi:UDP-glucose 4-epimerase